MTLRGCPLKPQCCPKAPVRRIPRSLYEPARDVARAVAKTDAFEQSRQLAHNVSWRSAAPMSGVGANRK
jgi:hypothetical protein